MNTLNRITFNPAMIGGKPCIRGMRVTTFMPNKTKEIDIPLNIVQASV